MILLLIIVESQVRFLLIIMYNILVKVLDWLFDDVAHLFLVLSIALLVCLFHVLDKAAYHIDTATEYIEQLKEIISDEGIVVADVCGTDAYEAWEGR